ncbi:MAG: ACT domain-containing protein [Acidobacteriota bacterium]
MSGPHLTIHLRTGRYAVSQLGVEAEIPQWAVSAPGMVSITRREGELSLVTLESAVPDGMKTHGGWRLLELEGPFEFSLTGILLSVLRPLAEAGVGIFALSTYDTDAVLVQEKDLDKALAALSAAGHRITGSQI